MNSIPEMIMTTLVVIFITPLALCALFGVAIFAAAMWMEAWDLLYGAILRPIIDLIRKGGA